MTELFTRAELAVDPTDAARKLLGATLEVNSPQGLVTARLVEVEAYHGTEDPASHSYRGRTRRNEVMWGPAGHLYVYFVYGMHFCANVVSSRDGEAGAVLLRAAEVSSGQDLAHTRRAAARRPEQLAQGPARLTSALGIGPEHNGADVLDPNGPVRLYRGERVPKSAIRSGPRVGVAAAMDTPWRFWIEESAAVSAYRRGGKTRARESRTSST